MGRWALVEDDGFRVVFRNTGRGRGFLVFAVGSVLVIGTTLAQLFPVYVWEPREWVAAGIVDAVLIAALAFARRYLDPGPLIVDASERRVFLPTGGEIHMDALSGLTLAVDARGFVDVVVGHPGGEVRLGYDRPDRAVKSAEAIARLTGLTAPGVAPK